MLAVHRPQIVFLSCAEKNSQFVEILSLKDASGRFDLGHSFCHRMIHYIRGDEQENILNYKSAGAAIYDSIF